MITIIDEHKMDSTDLETVKISLARLGVDHRATVRPGNGCIWAHYGMVNTYYIFQDHRLIDVQVD